MVHESFTFNASRSSPAGGIETMHISQTSFAISNDYAGIAGIQWQRNFFVPDRGTTKAKPKIEYICHDLLRAV
jgi:hypothetical protein